MTEQRLQYDAAFPSQKQVEEHIQYQFEQLGIKHDPSMRGAAEDHKELSYLLNHYLNYPDRKQAKIHRRSNKLGDIDHIDYAQKDNIRNVRESMVRAQNKVCKCCGFFVQTQELSVCNDAFGDINNIGTPTVVFFKTIINLALLMSVMVVIYSIFAFATNISESQRTGYLTHSSLAISLGAKSNANGSNDDRGQNYYLVSSWLGLAMLVIWAIIFGVIKRQVVQVEMAQKASPTVSDFSVVIDKMPTDLTQQQLQTQIDQYFRGLPDKRVNFRRLKIEKYNEAKPFYFNEEEFKDDQLDKIQKKTQNFKLQFIEWIKERTEDYQFSTTSTYRKAVYRDYTENQKAAMKKYDQIREKIIKQLREFDKQTKTSVFVTFQTIDQRNFFLEMNPNHLLSKVKGLLPCYQDPQRFMVRKRNRSYSSIVIQAAPEPEDVTWENIGVGKFELFCRHFFTIAATVVILAIAFVIVFGLSKFQQDNRSRRYISIIISLVISIFNLIIIKVLQFMTLLQRPDTTNKYQMSLAVKSIIAQLLNSIVTPILVNVHLKDSNIYEESGLIEDIFILAVASSFMPPLVRLIDPWYIFCWIVKGYYSGPFNRLGINQYELNRHFAKPQFELGLEYIYPISNFIFVCFFVSLQPIIPAFALLGLLAQYWIEKNALFHKSQRPVPGTDVMSGVMYQIIYFGAVAFALGSLTWTIFLPDSSFRSSIVPNFISLGVAVVILFFPYSVVVNYRDYSDNRTYTERRVYFPSEYDRLNPNTKNQGIDEYKQFLRLKKNEIQGMPLERQELLWNNLGALTQHNRTHQNNQFFFGKSERLIHNMLENESRNVLDPKLLVSYLEPGSRRHLGHPTIKPSESRLVEPQEEKQSSGNEMLYPDFKQDEIKMSIEKAEQDHARNTRMREMQRRDKPKANFMNMLNLSNRGQGNGVQNYKEDLDNIYKSNLFLGDLGDNERNEEQDIPRNDPRRSGSRDKSREKDRKDRKDRK